MFAALLSFVLSFLLLELLRVCCFTVGMLSFSDLDFEKWLMFLGISGVSFVCFDLDLFIEF